MSKRVRKFEPGECFASLDHFAEWCSKGNYVFLREGGQPKHGGFVFSMPFREVHKFSKVARHACVRQEWIDAQEEYPRDEMIRDVLIEAER